MSSLIQNQILEVKKALNGFDEAFISGTIQHKNDLEKIEKLIFKYKDYYKGTWYTNRYNVYQDLSGETNDLHKYSFDQINLIFGKMAEIDIKDLLDQVKNVYHKAFEIHEHIMTELSVIKDIESLASKRSQLVKLENYEWKIDPRRIIDEVRPRSGDFDQMEGIMGNYTPPPHIELVAETGSLKHLMDSIKQYPKSVKKLLREVELKIGITKLEPLNAIEQLSRLCNKFHQVAIQLRNRRGNRDTLIIKDEYDVQDLMHALLKINFDDVREEDFTPSHAGQNTRVDFLLKEERIVLEIKKTRSSLKDSQIGSELLLDINRYENHPDCDTLYCFVYDPTSEISNPKGLENDLMKSSNEKLKVIVNIVP